VASGYVLGTDPEAPRLPDRARHHPIVAFEAAVREALLRPPCAVAFSGGRDSSAVLAVAAKVARRDGLPLPIPLTLRFPTAPESDETIWQERVLGHLELEDWVRLEIVDELDCVGPYATAKLVRHGLYWPANAHLLAALLETVPGGALLTGDGGDLAFMAPDWADRLVTVLGRQARPRPSDILRLGFALSPPLLRRAVLRRRQPEPVRCPWLQPAALRAIEEELWSDAAHEPLRLDSRLEWGWRQRPIRMALAVFDLFAADVDAKLVHPFQASEFRASLAGAARSMRRFADRTEGMRWLFSRVLPDDVCARSTKGGFKDVFWNRHSRSFAEGWEGDGADSQLVRIDALRTLWRSPQARDHFRSCTQLQAAWLAQHARANGSGGDRVEESAGRLVD
jgi:asparagine synthase (glutamine-hydrolysing)